MIPILIYQGSVFRCILSADAATQLGINADTQDWPDTVCGEDSEEILTRIIMYCDGEHLDVPIELNHEGSCFWAIKTARPQSLRAYFWQDDKDMVISHFIKKQTPKLLPEDQSRMRRIKDYYDRHGGY